MGPSFTEIYLGSLQPNMHFSTFFSSSTPFFLSPTYKGNKYFFSAQKALVFMNF